jgi:hypothetical protein
LGSSRCSSPSWSEGHARRRFHVVAVAPQSKHLVKNFDGRAKESAAGRRQRRADVAGARISRKIRR